MASNLETGLEEENIATTCFVPSIGVSCRIVTPTSVASSSELAVAIINFSLAKLAFIKPTTDEAPSKACGVPEEKVVRASCAPTSAP